MNGNELVKDVNRFDKYARWLHDESRRETWAETTERVIGFFGSELEKQGKDISRIPWFELKQAMLKYDVLPSMRAVQMAGPAAASDHTCLYNCSYSPLDSPLALKELLYILMCGTGVGYSVEQHYIDQWPTPAMKHKFNNDYSNPDDKVYSTVRVEDSSQGWADAFYRVIINSLDAVISVVDYSQVRPKGAWLKTKGGRASGPEPLKRLLDKTQEIISSRAGMRLRPFDIHRLACLAGSIVDVGGVRRAALIALFSPSDEQMLNCKKGSWYEEYPELSKANNSAVASKDDIGRIFDSLSSDGYGEPGLFNRNSNHARSYGVEYGTNPCLHPDSLIETIQGQVRIADIKEPTMVYTMESNGSLGVRPCSASWISKTNASTINITVSSGKTVRCTMDHKIYIEGRGWVMAQNVQIGDKVVHLSRFRRGAAYSGVKLTTEPQRAHRMEHRLVWEAVNGAIPEGWDIHHIDGNTYNNCIDNLECLHHSDHARLTAIEQPNNHQVRGSRGFISWEGSKKGLKEIVPMPEHLKSNLHQYATVVKIEQGETTDVYDLAVEETHNFIADFIVVHNCSEILLEPKQFCNLSIAVARPRDNWDSLRAKVRLATIWGTIQSCMTYFPALRAEWKFNCERERLLGVDITGAQDCALLNSKNNGQAYFLQSLREYAHEVNRQFAHTLGVNPSAAITCNKPSGNSSQLVDCSSGIHARWSKYYIRRLRIEPFSPLGLRLKEKGIPFSVDWIADTPTAWIFEFPIKSPEGAVTRSMLDALDQLNYWFLWQSNWCDHNASSTIYVSPTEWPAVEEWVKEHWHQIGGLSFLPKDDHKYENAPYEEIDEKEYKRRVSMLPSSLELNTIVEIADESKAASEAACAGGFCEF